MKAVGVELGDVVKGSAPGDCEEISLGAKGGRVR
jgi:hypothetical protein